MAWKSCFITDDRLINIEHYLAILILKLGSLIQVVLSFCVLCLFARIYNQPYQHFFVFECFYEVNVSYNSSWDFMELTLPHMFPIKRLNQNRYENSHIWDLLNIFFFFLLESNEIMEHKLITRDLKNILNCTHICQD